MCFPQTSKIILVKPICVYTESGLNSSQSRGHFFSVVSLRVTHDGLSEREATRSLEGFLFRSEAAIEILARISIAASASPLTIAASLGKKITLRVRVGRKVRA